MNDEFNKIVAKELMLLRKNADMSNEKLAKKAKISPSTISRYEGGKNNMNLDIIEKIVLCCNSNMYIFFNKCIAKMQQNKNQNE
nr:MAG TPA: helix-turn-helix domain protein [Caudoviricetes sp.]